MPDSINPRRVRIYIIILYINFILLLWIFEDLLSLEHKLLLFRVVMDGRDDNFLFRLEQSDVNLLLQ